jgi:hypothetical protein
MFDAGRHYQQDIATLLGCSAQTVIRLTAEIEGVVGPNFSKGLDSHRRWYQIKSQRPYSLGLAFEEIRYLSLCRDLASDTLSPTTLMRLDDTLLKLSLLVTDQAGALPGVSPKNLLFNGKGEIDYSGMEEIIGKLLKAQELNKVCHVDYRASGREAAKDRYFAPGRLITLDRALYVLGAECTKDGGPIINSTLAVHKIQRISVLDKQYLGEFPLFVPGNFGLSWNEPKTYRLQFKAGKSADQVAERVWAEEQKVQYLPDGDVILTITTRSDAEIRTWIRSFGNQCSLLSVNDPVPSSK